MIGLTLLPCRSELHRHIKMITQFGDIMVAVFSYRQELHIYDQARDNRSNLHVKFDRILRV